jgi:hypothetical protein
MIREGPKQKGKGQKKASPLGGHLDAAGSQLGTGTTLSERPPGLSNSMRTSPLLPGANSAINRDDEHDHRDANQPQRRRPATSSSAMSRQGTSSSLEFSRP